MKIKHQQILKDEIKYKRLLRFQHYSKTQLRSLPVNTLWEEYFRATKILAKKYKESVRTTSEMNFEHKFKSFFSLDLFPSFWIGNHQVDFLIPQLNAYVEVDGGAHYGEGKMKKDAFKLNQITANFNLSPVSFSNHTVDFHFKFVLKTLHGLPRISTTDSQYLLKRLLLSVEGVEGDLK